MPFLNDDDDHFFVHVGIFLVLIFLDQLVKQLSLHFLRWGQSIHMGFFSITLVRNTGASFGILPDQGVLLIIIAIVALVLCFGFYSRFPENRLALIIVAAGIVGNVIDRFLHGYVVDMINVVAFPAVFNIADIMIFAGILSMIIYLWREDSKKKAKKA